MNKFREVYKNDMANETMNDAIYKRTLFTMKKVGSSGDKTPVRHRWGVIIPIAASLALTISAAAAVLIPRFLKPSEWGGYEGHIYTQNEGVAAEKNVDEDLWASIGIDINKSLSDNNLTVTVKDMVYDNSLLYVNFDITTNDGSPLQENTQYSKSVLNRQTFKDMYIECEGGRRYDLIAFRIDNAAVADKASFEGAIDAPGLLGGNIRFVLSDFLDMVERSSDIGFKYGSLAEACEGITPVTEDEFINIGTLFTYADGTKSYAYTIPAGDNKIYFSNDYPSAYIDNIGFQTVGEAKAKGLYVSIVPGDEDAEQLERGLAFKNIKTGDIIPSSYSFILDSGEDVDRAANNGRVILTIAPRSWTDSLGAADLADYTLTSQPSYETLVRAPGIWGFDLKVDKMGETKTFAIGGEINSDAGQITIDTIALSPLNLFIKGEITNYSGEKIPVDEVYLVMGDGSKQLASKKGAAGEFGNNIDLQYMLDKPVDVSEIRSIEILGIVVPLR